MASLIQTHLTTQLIPGMLQLDLKTVQCAVCVLDILRIDDEAFREGNTFRQLAI